MENKKDNELEKKFFEEEQELVHFFKKEHRGWIIAFLIVLCFFILSVILSVKQYKQEQEMMQIGKLTIDQASFEKLISGLPKGEYIYKICSIKENNCVDIVLNQTKKEK